MCSRSPSAAHRFANRPPVFGWVSLPSNERIRDATRRGGLPLTGETDRSRQWRWRITGSAATRWCTPSWPSFVQVATCSRPDAGGLRGRPDRLGGTHGDRGGLRRPRRFAHVRSRFPECRSWRAIWRHSLGDSAVDVVVNFRVIEHLWDQPQFITEMLTGVAPGRAAADLDPERITFTPGSGTRSARSTPASSTPPGWPNCSPAPASGSTGCTGVPRPAAARDGHPARRLDHRRPDRPGARRRPWPAELAADVAAVQTGDFDLLRAEQARHRRQPGPGGDRGAPVIPGQFTLVLHTHLPWLAHHGRWPVGEVALPVLVGVPACR